MTEPQKRWPGFNYEQVPGLANRLISRYLRSQRKNMRRFFEERGMFIFADRMNQIRKSRQGMLAKNRMFQGVLNDYAALSTPTVQSSAPVPGQVGPLQIVRPTESQGMEISASGAGEVQINAMAQSEPGEDTGNSEQVIGVSNTDQTIAKDL